MDKRDRVAAILQGLGLSSLVFAGWTVGAGLGLATLGVGLILWGIAVDRERDD